MKTKTIMAVDDDEMILKLVEVVVENLESKFIGVPSGEACLNQLKNTAPDMLILDVQMSGIDGLELLKLIREAHPELKAKVLFLTAHKKPELIARAGELGCDGFVLKPIDPHRLRARIKETFNPSIVDKD